MCKAMASERNGCNLGRDSQGGLEQAGPSASAALTAADPQIGTSLPGTGLHTPSGPISTFQHPELSAFERAGRDSAPTLGSSLDSVQQVPSMSPSTGPMPATLSVPSTSSQSTELMFMHSIPSSALSGYSLPVGLQEAMQQMRLQTPAGPGSTQQQQPPGVPRTASASPAGQPHLGPSESQSSADIAQLLGQVQQQHAQQEQQGAANEDGPATLFFAKVPRTATREQIQDVFARFGEVVSINLFTPYENSPTSKGCGLVVLRSYSEAASAIAGLDSYKWEGMHSAMVVKLMPPQRQRQEHTIGALEGAAGGRSPAQATSSRAALSPMPRSGSYTPGAQLRMVMGMDMPPPGCAPNAYKLFVGNIPRAYAEPDLLPIFESIGTVRELVVLRDRETQESKGSAFVWYATGEDADKAQVSFNMQLVLQSRAGTSSRPLAVRRAAPSKQGQHASGLGSGTVGVAYPAQMQQAYAVPGQQGPLLGQSSYGQMGRAPQQGAYGQGTSLSAQGPAQVYYDAQGQIAMVPPGSYLQQQQQVQQQAPQQHQAAHQQQQLWQQQQVPAVVHCQAQAAQYAGSVLMSVSEGPAAGYTQVLQVQQGSWQPQLQQQQQPAYMATGYDMSQVPGGIPASGPLPYAGVDYAAQQPPQPQQAGMAAAVMVSSMPQAIPAAQQVSAGGMLPQAGPMLASSMSPSRSVVFSGSTGSSGSSNVGPLASYQQLGAQHHSLVIPLSGEQLSMINSQLQKVMAMSGTSITAEHNFACDSLALNVIAASRQQLNVAWQIIQGLLGQQSGAAAQMAEGML